MDQTAFFELSYGLYTISTTSEGKDADCAASTLHQVTSSPTQFAVTLNKDDYTEQLTEKSGYFSTVVLTQNCGMDIIKNFGFCSSKDNDKFAQCTYRRDTHGVPYPSEHVATRYSPKIVKTLDLGTHVMFIGEVEEAEVLSEEEVMAYVCYHQVKSGTAPKNTPSYQEKSEKSGWRCTICGYIYKGDPLPQNYVCPLCGAPVALFEKLQTKTNPIVVEQEHAQSLQAGNAMQLIGRGSCILVNLMHMQKLFATHAAEGRVAFLLMTFKIIYVQVSLVSGNS